MTVSKFLQSFLAPPPSISSFDDGWKVTVLLELHCTVVWNDARSQRKYPPMVFAAHINRQSKETLLRSIDHVCLNRTREILRYTSFGTLSVINYEVDRYFMWKGLDEAKLPITGLTELELSVQFDLIEQRGYQDFIRVDMALELATAITELEHDST